MSLSTDQKGNVAEQALVLAATRLGLPVLRPTGEGARYDLVLDLGSRLLRVQCKWARREGEVIVMRCQSARRAREGLRSRSYTTQEVDAFAAYCADNDECYLLPIELVAGRRQIQLRLTPPRNNQRGAIVWAREFKLSAIDWTSFEPFGGCSSGEERSAGSRKGVGSNPTSSTASPVSSAVQRVGAHEFRNHFGWYMERAAAGEAIEVSRRGRPYVRLVGAEAPDVGAKG